MLRRVEDDILIRTGNRIERLVALDRGGRVLLARDGAASQIRLSLADFVRLFLHRPFLLTHNHRFATAPSDADVRLAVVVSAVEVNSFGPEIRWRVQRGPAGWPPRWQITDRFRAALTAKRAAVYDSGIQAIHSAGQQPTAADRQRLWVDTLEAIWQELTAADPTHWAFVKEPRK